MSKEQDIEKLNTLLEKTVEQFRFLDDNVQGLTHHISSMNSFNEALGTYLSSVEYVANLSEKADISDIASRQRAKELAHLVSEEL